MNEKKFALLVFLFYICIFTVKADMAPDPGYTRMHVDLILETQDDFPDYRFFLQTPVDIEEISLKKGETKNFEAGNRGGPKRFVTVLAIPSDALARSGVTVFGKGDSYNDPKWLHEEISEKKIEGVVELVKHSFQRTIATNEMKNWKAPVYKLERDKLKGIKAGLSQTNSGSVELYGDSETFNSPSMALIVGGSFMSAAILFLGIWFFRRKRQITN